MDDRNGRPGEVDNDPALSLGEAVIVFHGHSDAVAALDAALLEMRKITLITPHGAAAWLGAAYFQALQRQLAKHPALDRLIYDCADITGAVLAALRHNITWVRADPAMVTPALQDLATRHGSILLTERPH